MQPAALNKAEALNRHLAGQRKASTQITLCDREAWEFLDWYRTNLMVYQPAPDQAAFEADYTLAEELGTPWLMLKGFDICGFQLTRLDGEVH